MLTFGHEVVIQIVTETATYFPLKCFRVGSHVRVDGTGESEKKMGDGKDDPSQTRLTVDASRVGARHVTKVTET